MKVSCALCQRYHFKPEGNPNEVSHAYCPRCAALLYKEGADQRGKKLTKKIIERLKNNIKKESEEGWQGEDQLAAGSYAEYLNFYQELLNEIKSETEGMLRK